ncbi:MAG: guanylate kinase [Bacteroidota bacterium]
MSKLVIFTAPSGAGKTTIVRHLLDQYDQLAFSVSVTTRQRRPHETDGADYYFLTREDFEARVAAGEFLEWEEVYEGQYYGTLRSEIDRLWELGKCIIFDIEVKGATNIKNTYPDQSLAVFVKPPSPTVLFERLRARQTETEASLQKRIRRASEELTYENSFDAVLLNDVLEDTLRNAEQLIETYLQD